MTGSNSVSTAEDETGSEYMHSSHHEHCLGVARYKLRKWPSALDVRIHVNSSKLGEQCKGIMVEETKLGKR